MATATNEAVSHKKGKNGRRDVTINVRATTHVRDLIDRAASVIGKSRSDFMIESARARAEDVLLDQTLFLLDSKKHDEFLKILNDPPPPSDKLRRLITGKAPWEK